jgi:hypothetical protein
MLLAMGGCQATQNASDGSSAINIEAEWGKPWLAYLRRQPYQKMVVQVDCVEGAEVTNGEVKAIKDFLATHVDKPGGIEMRVGKPVPLAMARAVSAEQLAAIKATEQADALPADAAFMHLLFVDKSRMKGLPAWERWAKSHTEVWPFTGTAFIDVSNVDVWTRRTVRQTAEHEIGHLLGLVSRRALNNGGHCDSPNCLMKPSFSMHWAVLFPRSLCQKCEADLRMDRESMEACNMRFWGPFVVRMEKGYYVAMLPSVTALGIGEPDAGKLPEVVKRAWKLLGTDKSGKGSDLGFYIDDVVDTQQFAAAIELAGQDRQEMVRTIAKLWIQRRPPHNGRASDGPG